jgi:hypothetical protein
VDSLHLLDTKGGVLGQNPREQRGLLILLTLQRIIPAIDNEWYRRYAKYSSLLSK